MIENKSTVQISKPRIAIGLVVYALGLWATLKISSGLYGYFAYDYPHPYTLAAHLIGLHSPFKTFSQLSIFDGGIELIVTFLSLFLLYLGLASCTLLATLELGARISGTKLQGQPDA
jgi:hypothetical protein